MHDQSPPLPHRGRPVLLWARRTSRTAWRSRCPAWQPDNNHLGNGVLNGPRGSGWTRAPRGAGRGGPEHVLGCVTARSSVFSIFLGQLCRETKWPVRAAAWAPGRSTARWGRCSRARPLGCRRSSCCRTGPTILPRIWRCTTTVVFFAILSYSTSTDAICDRLLGTPATIDQREKHAWPSGQISLWLAPDLFFF